MSKPKTTPYARKRDGKTRELFYEHWRSLRIYEIWLSEIVG